MGRIKKTAEERHEATISPFISDFIQKGLETPLHRLPSLLDSFPQSWPFPRGDLYHWIPALNRFDWVLERFISEYELSKGPQTQPFERRVLVGSVDEELSASARQDELDACGYGQDGDRELVESILRFCTVLLQHCGNRSLYSSSDRLNELLHTTSISLLKVTMQLGLKLAFRYYASKMRMSSPTYLSSMLGAFFILDQDKLHRQAVIFPTKPRSASLSNGAISKSKDHVPETNRFDVADINAIVRSPTVTSGMMEEFMELEITYYEPTSGPPDTDAAPSTPTPVRRASNLSQSSTPNQDRPAVENGPSSPSSKHQKQYQGTSASQKIFRLDSELASKPAWEIMKDHLNDLPPEHHYELLHRVRIASAMLESKDAALDAVAVRLLSVSNLAYIYSESTFYSKFGQQDAEQPRQLQLVNQLAEMLQPSGPETGVVSREMASIALITLEALLKNKYKLSDIASALSINVSHGVLFYVLRQVVISLTSNLHDNAEEQWRDCVFTLVNSLTQTNHHQRHGEMMVAAGLIGILVEILSIRNAEAARHYHDVLNYFDNFIHNGIRDAFQSLVNARGLDTIADLTSYAVQQSLEAVRSDQGMPEEYQTKMTDYRIPFFHQQTLRLMFKFIEHMFMHNTGAQDRLLRNLIDSPPLLGGLRTVIEDAHVFGSNVWTGALNIVSSFINGEPTSYNVIAEAGLSQSILKSIAKALPLEEIPPALDAATSLYLPHGILPTGEVMRDIPGVFGAICLNENGLRMFQTSGALDTFFSIFTSPGHLRGLQDSHDVASSIGSSFDEIARHHPELKEQIAAAVRKMVRNVSLRCSNAAMQHSVGAKLWIRTDEGDVIAGGRLAAAGIRSAHGDGDHTHKSEYTQASMKPSPSDYIEVVCRFLKGFLSNAAMCTSFCEKDGMELMMQLVTSAGNPYNFHEYNAFNELSNVIVMMVEQKPHLTLPNVLYHTQNALDYLRPMIDDERERAFFHHYTSTGQDEEGKTPLSESSLAAGTLMVKDLVIVQNLCHILSNVFSASYSHHRTPPHSFFTQVNLTDKYIEVVKSLGQLHAACIWEEIMMQKKMPDEWKLSTRVKGTTFDNAEANNVMGQVLGPWDSPTDDLTAAVTSDQGQASQSLSETYLAAFKNTETLRYLLSQTPAGVACALQALGKALLAKTRAMDSYQRQNAHRVADEIAKALIGHLNCPTPGPVTNPNDRLAYEIVVLSSMTQVLIDKRALRSGGVQPEILTLLLQKFYRNGGLNVLGEILTSDCRQITNCSWNDGPTANVNEPLSPLLMASAELILDFFAKITQAKNISESQQSASMSSGNHDPKHAYYFTSSQFIVELRHAVLPHVNQLWKDNMTYMLDTPLVKAVIISLKAILEADGEANPIVRGDRQHLRVPAEKEKWKPRSSENLDVLTSASMPRDLALEALFRCNDNVAQAREYAALRNISDRSGYCRPPDDEVTWPNSDVAQGSSSRSAAESGATGAANLARVSSVEMQDGDQSPGSRPVDEDMADAIATTGSSSRAELPADLATADLLENAPGLSALLLGTTNLPHGRAPRTPSAVREVETKEAFVTLEDLEDLRKELRPDLVDKCLNLLDTQGDITFELADLIASAPSKQPDAANLRSNIGETLVNTLMSLQPDEGMETGTKRTVRPGKDAQSDGDKIASYAHLLALVIQDKDFFDATLGHLTDSFESLVGFIKLPPSISVDDAASYISNVLLISERVLAEDESPQKISWKANNSDRPQESESVELTPPSVALDDKEQLFRSILELLPKVAKHESLALSILRTLVMLTRHRSIAKMLGEKPNIGRLFLMIKQLAGSSDEKLQGTFLIVLRHIVEDDDMIRQIMRTEIQQAFDNSRASRSLDTTTYTRNLYHLCLRNPELFVEVTNEKVQLTRYDPSKGPQAVSLKKVEESPENADSAATAKSVEPTSAGESKPVLERTKTTDMKPPVVENPDGVIQFLLKELSSYKDVEDRPPPTQAAQANTASSAQAAGQDVEMTEATPPPGTDELATRPPSSRSKSNDKPTFKADENPIFVYRCFILQCLVELLASYNRTKVEFINFTPKAEYLPSTPSKPRSGLLNYLLTNLIPVGTLTHADDIAHRKRLLTSNWAISVVVALCTKTSERIKSSEEFSREEETDLVYVRKFVLEHALKVYKDVLSSTESLDRRYSRLLALSDLFNRMLTSKPPSGNNANGDSVVASQKQLGKLMFEKHFIPALTTSIAEIDLNFPNAKRAVKYILRPLKWLTEIAVTSNTSSDTSLSGTTDEDEISSATSVSEDENEREETPDLFRNSTLGMFEAGQEDDSGSESGDEDEEIEDDFYGEEYEEMEYEEHGEVISDEELEGMGEIEGMPGDDPINMTIGGDSDDDGSSDEDDSDDDDDEDDDDEDDDDDQGSDDIEIIEEITGDEENDSAEEGGDEADWEDEGDDGFVGHELGMDDGGRASALDHMARVLDGDDLPTPFEAALAGIEGEDDEDVDMGPVDYYGDEMDEDEEDEEGEEYDEAEIVYEPEEDDDDEAGHGMGWAWEETPVLRHHHHHSRIPPDPWSRDLRQLDEQYGAPTYRSHRGSGIGRGSDDGTNPLLQRADTQAAPANGRSRYAMPEMVFSADYANRAGRQGGPGQHDMAVLSDIVQMVGQNGARIGILEGGPGGFPGGFSPFVVTAGPGGLQYTNMRNRTGFDRQMPGGLTNLLRGIRHPGGGPEPAAAQHRSPQSDPAHAIYFIPTLTTTRWQEEARILYVQNYQDKAMRVINSILRLLVPPAQEAKKQKDKAEAERKAAEEKTKEEQRKKDEAEKAEREAKEKKEREEREAREAAEAAERAQEEAQAGNDDSQMEGIEDTSQIEAINLPSQPTEPAQRVTTMLRGRQLDITALGIDPTFLEAVPQELHEDLIVSHLTERQTQAAQTGEQPSGDYREFLEQLPPDIQRELLRTEARERRHRERDEAARTAASSDAAPTVAQAEDMNNADFMAMLDPSLRQSVLMEADENVLAALPAELQAEARALLGDRGVDRQLNQLRDMRARMTEVRNREQPPAPEQDTPRRPVAQILDKAGVATLLRLMFIAIQGSARATMHSILSDICKNTQNRAEVISILLSILQDGSSDGNALERSFAQLTVRAKQVSGSKTPQAKKGTATGQIQPPTNDISPLMVVQQCLTTLTNLANDNPRVSSFFLSEHETITSQRAKSAKKGKGKEARATKFPLNALLTLLDRKSVIDNAAVMEHLAALLVRVSEPLKILFKKAKEAEKEGENKAAESAAVPEASADVAMADGSRTAATEGESTQQAEVPDEDATAKPEAKSTKKHRDLTPPEVPEENLCLVVNIIAARDCSSKTFQNTLEIINHLSAIPGARDIFGKELVRRAQELGAEVLVDLGRLAPQIQNAKTSTEIQGVALASFSRPGSQQYKLLRVLLALDYICEPKRVQDRPAASVANGLPQQAKENLIASLYESSTFVKLWASLSDCLTAIRQRENLTHVATILQPLVESFMVVCKNTTVKEVSMAASQELLPIMPSSESRIEKLFFSFTEEHRKILNDLVRHNPKLMNGTFDVLVKNSKVLEFDNKRYYFSKRLHARSTEERQPHGTLQLHVRRDQVFLDSFKALFYKRPNEIKYGKLNIRFHGEEGVDAGGVTREWFGALSRQMFDPSYALFNPVAADRTTFHPNPLSAVNDEHLTFFKFIGRIIGKALYEGRVLDCHFSRAVYKRILGKAVSLKDMETLDLDYYKSLCWILENDITDVTFETFSVEQDRFGETQVVDLIPNGREVPVTEENKHEYVRLVVEQRLSKSVEEQLESFLQGFREIVPTELITIFNEQELELLISGLPDIDVDDWKNNTEYHNYQASSPQAQWFWRAVRSFDKEEKAKLLQFVTGTSKVPLNGFKELEGMNGFSRFNIHRDFGSKDRLPSSHTCFNQLDLPEYESYEALRQQLYTAMTAGNEYFGFA